MRLELNIQLFAASATITNARQGNYSIEDNNEVQRLTFTVKRTSGTTFWQDNKTLTFRLTYTNDDGTTTTLTQTTQFNFPSGSVGATKSTYVYFTVPHKTDGTQNITYEASIATGTSVGTLHPTGSATLETIPRASSITVNDANIGSATNIVINKASANFTTTLYYKASGQSNWTKIVDKTSNQVYGWTVPTSFYSLIPNSKSLQCEFYAETYNENTLIGTSSTVTATFTATGNPVINSCTLESIDWTTINALGSGNKMIRYISTVQATVSASGQNSAYISSIVINRVTANSSGIATFPNANTNSYEVTVTDSRGYSVSNTYQIDWTDYIPLTINATVIRNQPTDGIINISYNGNYYNGSFLIYNDTYVPNTLAVEYRYVEKGQDITQATWQPLSPTISDNTYSQSNYQISGFDYQKQYEFQIRAVDYVQTQQINGINVSKGEPVFWWNDDGLYALGDIKINGTSLSDIFLGKSGGTISGNLNVTGNLQKSGNNVALGSDIPTKTSDLTNDSNFTTLDIANGYSINETLIGKWIDGSPIYRKVLTFTTSSNNVTAWTDIADISSELNNIINLYGYTVFGSNKTPIPRYEDTSYYLIFLASGSKLRYRCVGFRSTTCYLVVEYTKI